MSQENEWPLVRVVVDDDVIAGNDLSAIIEPVWWTANFYESYADYEESLKSFSWPQRLVWAVMWHNAEVCNGGHDQFFANSTGMVWPEALEGYEAVGCSELATILGEAVARFNSPPSRERDAREEQLGADEIDFDDLDGRYFDNDDTVWDALLAYVRQHREAFHFDGLVAKPASRRES
jgi:hypothetical protein